MTRGATRSSKETTRPFPARHATTVLFFYASILFRAMTGAPQDEARSKKKHFALKQLRLATTSELISKERKRLQVRRKNCKRWCGGL